LEKQITLEIVLAKARQLSNVDKVRLIEQTAALIRKELEIIQSTTSKSDVTKHASTKSKK
jgi:hypothetical protein